MLAARSNAPVEPVEAVGLDGDMLEAQAFAYLAVRVLRGLPTSAPGDDRGAVAGLGRADQPAVGPTRFPSRRQPHGGIRSCTTHAQDMHNSYAIDSPNCSNDLFLRDGTACRLRPSTKPAADAPAGGGRDSAATRGARARLGARRSRRHPPRPPRWRSGRRPGRLSTGQPASRAGTRGPRPASIGCKQHRQAPDGHRGGPMSSARLRSFRSGTPRARRGETVKPAQTLEGAAGGTVEHARGRRGASADRRGRPRGRRRRAAAGACGPSWVSLSGGR